MLIRLAQNSDKERWNAYVQSHPDASPYHLWAWRESIREAYDHKAYYFIAEEDIQICGILALIQIKLPLLQNQLVSLPFCDLGGPLVNSRDTEVKLLNEAIKLGQKLGVSKIEIRSRAIDIIDTTPNQPETTEKVSMLLPLPHSAEELWSGFKSKLRSQVCKAEKNGLFFKWGHISDINAFYDVFSQNMHELGSPVHSKKWIKTVLANYGEKAKMGLVFLKDQPVGCGIVLLCGKNVSIPWASTLRQLNRLGPNMLLYWNLLKFSIDNGYAVFDFGRSTFGEGTYKFKTQWGSTPHPLQWQNLMRDRTDDLKTKNNRRTRDIAENIWTHLPLWVANAIGPNIRKYISL